MVLPLGSQTGNQMVMRVRKQADGTVTSEALFPVRFVPLVAGEGG